MAMEIVGKALTTYQVDPAGDSFRLNVEDVDGRPASVVLPVDCLRSLLMTLPGLIEQALKARYSDDTLKIVYPVCDWSLQAANGDDRLILTLATPDDFRVSFALTGNDAESLASSLGDGAQRIPAKATN
jgi:hypothetical protein